MKHVLLSTIVLFSSIIHAQDGIPEPDRSIPPTYRFFTFSENGTNKIERNIVPEIIRDFGEVGYISKSTIDSSRSIEDIPNFHLTEFHWWLFGFEILPRAQRQFADLIGEIKGYQRLLGHTVLIDDPQSPFYTIIIGVREYLVPFKAVETDYEFNETLLPDLAHMKQHTLAALDSINTTVFFKGMFKPIRDEYKKQVIEKIRVEYLAELKKSFNITPKRRR